MNDKLCPVYWIGLRWAQDGKQHPQYDRNTDLPEGRIYNSTGMHRMYKEDPGTDSVRKEAEGWWEKLKAEDKYKERNLDSIKITIKFIHNESWCGGWFQHWTFDVGQSDREAEISFEQFVQRMKELNYQEARKNTERSPTPAYVLMGAEDRYRWCGSTDDCKHSDSIPCRCKHCKKRGVLTINH